MQESLTNVIKHAGPASAAVGVRYDDAAISIEIADNGRGAAPGLRGVGTGHGLIGMRERAASVGGTLQAGPGQQRGYVVTALLPAEAKQAADTQPDSTATGAASGAQS